LKLIYSTLVHEYRVTLIHARRIIYRKNNIIATMPPNYKSTMVDLETTPVTEYEVKLHDEPTECITRNLSHNTLTALAALKSESHEVQVTHDNALRPLQCAIQKYAWGRIGSDSMAARMRAAQAAQHEDDDFVIDESTPYAELWLGTHPNGTCTVAIDGEFLDDPEDSSNVSLIDYVRSDCRMHCGKTGHRDLTFLFKVLSINKVLSIQAHPDKKLAEKLHAERPKVYKDANHKPEMAIAMSDEVQAMCGFRPIRQIANHLEQYPELAVVVGEEPTAEVIRLVNSPATRAVLQRMFKGYMECSNEIVQEQLEKLLTRLRETEEPSETEALMLQLADQFPGDAGIMAPLIFNHFKFGLGEALFIGANEPHAYISGEILECMACSDNVVRAGLTPKLKDVDTLVSMLTYNCGVPKLEKARKINEHLVRYESPVADFCVEKVQLGPQERFEIHDVQSPSVFLTLAGSGTLCQGAVQSLDVSFGSAAFASANTRATLVAGPNGLVVARALTNVYHDSFLLAMLKN